MIAREEEPVQVAAHPCSRCLFGPNPLVPARFTAQFREFACRQPEEWRPLTCHRAQARGTREVCAHWWARFGTDWEAEHADVPIVVVPLPERTPTYDGAEYTDQETGQGSCPLGIATLECVRINSELGTLEYRPEWPEPRFFPLERDDAP